jgi:hypothetical protein
MTDYPELHPWQAEVIKQFNVKHTVSTGRQLGKSWVNYMMQQAMDDLVDNPVQALICDTGTIFNYPAVTVRPIGGNWRLMVNWCVETFGPESRVLELLAEPERAGRWYTQDRVFWFSEPRDREWFVLKWTPNGD